MKTRLITVGRITDTVAGWAKRSGISESIIYKRLRRVYSPDEAVASSWMECKRRMLSKTWHGKWVFNG